MLNFTSIGTLFYQNGIKISKFATKFLAHKTISEYVANIGISTDFNVITNFGTYFSIEITRLRGMTQWYHSIYTGQYTSDFTIYYVLYKVIS